MSYEIEHAGLSFVVEPYYDGEDLWATVQEIKGCDAYDMDQLSGILGQDGFAETLSRKLVELLKEESDDRAAYYSAMAINDADIMMRTQA